ncbi:MAG: pilin [Patescibacteria group bacterium]
MKYFPSFLAALFLLPLITLGQETGFVSLTDAPFLKNAGNAASLPDFLNDIYRICIGAAAVIAVLQIMRAGIMYMGGDSVTEKKEAKNLIGMAIGGLILVLSPVIVFSIINPDILSLRINNLDKLAPTAGETAGQGDGSCSTVCDASEGQICRSGQCVEVTDDTCPTTPIGNGVSVPSERGQRCCAAQTGCTVQAGIGDPNAIPVCSCTAPAAPARYGWRGVFENERGSRSTQQQGTFATKALCEQSLGSWPAENGQLATGEFSCNCNTPISQQSTCTGF